MTVAAGRADVAVVGGGPAAWAAAAACAEADLRVVLLAPDPEAPWAATYGAWLDDLDPGDFVLARRWEEVTVVAGSAGSRELFRPYGVFDNRALAERLRARATGHGVTTVRGDAVGAAAGHDGVALLTSAGLVIDAAVVVDASGAPAALVRAPAPPAWQVAHGIVARIEGEGRPSGSCLLMDWTTVAGEPDPQPSFLYALDLGGGRWLLEETVLAAVRPLAPTVLARRLARRLDARGVRVTSVERTESVRIPMGLVAPRCQAVVGFGAAGGLVHPATGYSVAASLRLAPTLAAGLAAARRRGAPPAGLAKAGWDAVWPADRRRARALERFGLDAMLRMDQADLGGFFDVFFSLPVDHWAGYLAGTASAADVAGIMARLFRAAPWELRRRLAAGDPRSLLRALRA